MIESRPRLHGNKLEAWKHITKEENRVLIVGDIHAPFELKSYLAFCKDIYAKYNCNKVVMIGDLLDNHFASYHESSADGMGGGQELEVAIQRISKWYDAFPEADVTLGNHDLLIMRKAQTSSVPSKWIKSFKEVLETPNWNFIEEIEIDDVLYCHGVGSKAHIRAVKNMQSTVQGHHHTEAYAHWFVGKKQKVFGMQVGCGIDSKSYAMAYGKWFPKSAIGCGVVLGGHTPINVLMDL